MFGRSPHTPSGLHGLLVRQAAPAQCLHQLVGSQGDDMTLARSHFRSDAGQREAGRLLTPRVASQASLDAFEHADTPLHMVMVEILGLNMKGAAAAPLFQSMLFLHEADWWRQVHLQGLTTYTHPVEKNIARQAVWALPGSSVRAAKVLSVESRR